MRGLTLSAIMKNQIAIYLFDIEKQYTFEVKSEHEKYITKTTRTDFSRDRIFVGTLGNKQKQIHQ